MRPALHVLMMTDEILVDQLQQSDHWMLLGTLTGFVAPGDKYSGLATLPLLVVSELVILLQTSQRQRCMTQCASALSSSQAAQCVTHGLSGLEQHDDSEYGDQRTRDGAHCGGPFWIKVSPKMRVDEVRHVVSVS